VLAVVADPAAPSRQLTQRVPGRHPIQALVAERAQDLDPVAGRPTHQKVTTDAGSTDSGPLDDGGQRDRYLFGQQFGQTIEDRTRRCYLAGTPNHRLPVQVIF